MERTWQNKQSAKFKGQIFVVVWMLADSIQRAFQMGDRFACSLKKCIDWSNQTVPEKFENGGFPLKTYQMFFVHTTPEEFKNAPISGHVGFVFEENSGSEITWLSWRHRYRKSPFSNCFPSRLKFKAVFFEERFQFRFHDGLVWTVGLTVEIKLRFHISPAWCERLLSALNSFFFLTEHHERL